MNMSSLLWSLATCFIRHVIITGAQKEFLCKALRLKSQRVKFIFQEVLFSFQLRLTVHNTQPLQFTLTAINVGSATTITWTRNSVEVEGGVTVSVGPLISRHVLNASEEGVYTCTVSNDRLYPSRLGRITRTLNVTSM